MSPRLRPRRGLLFPCIATFPLSVPQPRLFTRLSLPESLGGSAGSARAKPPVFAALRALADPALVAASGSGHRRRGREDGAGPGFDHRLGDVSCSSRKRLKPPPKRSSPLSSRE